ncbi:MAG: hypothetical protein JEZ12_25520 [Desulfobacterium sp.]|nr:hypothetical protein [Desulfobacterium sp.]
MDKNVNISSRGFHLKGNKSQIKKMQNYMKETFGGDVTAAKLSILVSSFPQVRREMTKAARI